MVGIILDVIIVAIMPRIWPMISCVIGFMINLRYVVKCCIYYII